MRAIHAPVKVKGNSRALGVGVLVRGGEGRGGGEGGRRGGRGRKVERGEGVGRGSWKKCWFGLDFLKCCILHCFFRFFYDFL